MDVLAIVQSKLKDVPEDELILPIAEVEQLVLNYCNLKELPRELNFTVANMVVDLYNRQNNNADQSQDGSVTSIKEGDVTVQFGAAQISASEHAMEGVLFDYKDQLNQFRRLRW